MEREAHRLAFIVGTGRCGSTLLQEALCLHPDVGFVSNVDNRMPGIELKGRFNNALYRSLPPWLAARSASGDRGRASALARIASAFSIRFAPSEAYDALRRRVSPMLVDPHRDLVASDAMPWVKSRMTAFFDGRARVQDKAVFVHKFTGWPRTGLLDACFPGARFVHIVRDGRAVASSVLQMPWWRGYRGPQRWGYGPLPDGDRQQWEASGRSFCVLAALEWKLLMEAYERAEAAVDPDRWLQVRHEDFLRAPAETLREILDFLGLGWTDAMAGAVDGIGIRRDREAAYLRELRPEDVEAATAVMEPHLKRLGYLEGSPGG
ncbi:MAG: sulfotransferase [Actinomycetota bacterium]|nr:sulfotransferase [Actinomycetota bacterium]